jgi:hypothetical protein
MRSVYAAFCGGSMAQLWPLRNWLDQTERQKLLGTLPLFQKPRALQSAQRAAALALKRDFVLGARYSPFWRPLGLFFGTYPNSSVAAYSGRYLIQRENHR